MTIEANSQTETLTGSGSHSATFGDSAVIGSGANGAVYGSSLSSEVDLTTGSGITKTSTVATLTFVLSSLKNQVDDLTMLSMISWPSFWNWTTGCNLTTSIVSGALGGGLLGKWFMARVNSKHTKQLEELRNSFQEGQQRLQAEIDRSVGVRRTHFEAEFLAMKEVSQRLAKVKNEFEQLNPTMFDEELHDFQDAFAPEFRDVYMAYKAKMEEWAVFLEPDIYDEFRRAYLYAEAEFHRIRGYPQIVIEGVRQFPEGKPPLQEDKNQIHQHFYSAYSRACEKVRNRIKELAIIPDTLAENRDESSDGSKT